VRSIPDPALVFLIGAAGSGKSTWAAERYLAEEIVSSDRLRAVVGSGEADLDASADAFALLDQIVAARLGRRLTAVVDTTGLDQARRTACLGLARGAGVRAVAVVFATPAGVCRARNRLRSRPVPAQVLGSQLERAARAPDEAAVEGWDEVVVIAGAEEAETLVPRRSTGEATTPTGLRFVLNLARFNWPGGAGELRGRLAEAARAAEAAGFWGISVMDHLVQIPQVGRTWEDIPDPFTTLAQVAAVTDRLRVGALVANTALRNPALLAKTVATLDVLSAGRVFCGLGTGWNASEERAYGYPPVSTRWRLDRLEDAAELLPLMWGKGAVHFAGRTITVEEAVCYPRPLQARVPIVIGGGGERRTLLIAARHADAINIVGDLDRVRAKRAVLDRHCETVGRDPAEVETTVLDVTVVGEDRRMVADLVEAHRGRAAAATYSARTHAGTIEAQADRYRSYHDAGIGTVFVSLPDLAGSEQVERFGAVIRAT
jgi:alkanesulfonate monooxygenase SsuD/methylene tetrahydromethanopterin reductase-like flavin-dependent oxidoreductase (luciferase family)/predicted kinase